jgi:ribosomal protein L14
MDNSGAKKLKVIKILKNHGKTFGYIGHDARVTVEKINKRYKRSIEIRKQIKKGQKIFHGFLTATTFPIIRKDGTQVKFDKNLSLLFRGNIYKKKELLQSAGNKTVFGPVANELLQRNFRRKYFKFISIYIKKFI